MSKPPLIPWNNLIESGNRIFVGSNAAVPHALMQNLIENSQGLHDIEVVHILTMGDNAWARKEHSDLFKVNSFFLGPSTRDAVADGYADYTPCFLSEIPGLFEDGILPLDAALVMVSPPDQHGYCSFGVSVDTVSAACRAARKVIAQINPRMPVTSGQSFIHINEITATMEAEEPLFELHPVKMDPVTSSIGRYVSTLIEDGSTLQLGIGKIPDAVLHHLQHHKDLGLHTEMFSDGIIDLMTSGVINNRKKTFHYNKSVTSFCIGSQRLYDFVDRNPHIEFYPSEHVNAPANIARNDNMISINSAIEVDLTGQVVSDSVGYRFYSGIGGQVDFIRGDSMSKGGKPIIALPRPRRMARSPRLSRMSPKAAASSLHAATCTTWLPSTGLPRCVAKASANGRWNSSRLPIRISAISCWSRFANITGCQVIRNKNPPTCRKWGTSNCGGSS